MTGDLLASIGHMRDIVSKLRHYPMPEPQSADRDKLVEILEEQIREMEQRAHKGEAP